MSLKYTIISSANSNNVTYSFPICILVTSLCFLIALSRSSSIILSKYGESGQPCLLPEFIGIAWSFSPFSLMLATSLLYITFTMFHISLEFLIFPRHLPWKDAEFCQMLFQDLMKWPCVFFFFEFDRVVNYIVGFLYIKASQIPGKKPTWSWWMILLMCTWIQLARVLLNISTLIFAREIVLMFTYFVGILCGFGISVFVAS